MLPIRTIGDPPGSDNVAAALRLVGQVVWYCAAASGTGTAGAAASESRLSLLTPHYRRLAKLQ